MTNGTAALFDRKQLRAHRERAQHRAALAHPLFDAISAQLIERLEGIKRPFSRVLDLGSRSFSVVRTLSKQDATRFIVHAHSIPSGASIGHHVCIADEEWLPFRDASFDLIISNLHLHWANDLPGALVQIRRALKPDGFFIAALIGGETLRELRECLYEAEMELRGGVSQHISPFADIRDCGGLLQRAGFALPVVDKERFTLTYRDSFQLMRELRDTGEGNVLNRRDKRIMPRDLFKRADRLYRDRYAHVSVPDASAVIPATCDVLFIAGWAPHDNQQKPLKPGEAQERLAKVLNTSEIKVGDHSAP